MTVSVDSIWAKAKTLSASDRLLLSRRLRESVSETEAARKDRAAREIDAFFGGWSEDPRSTEGIIDSIRQSRTTNTFPQIY